MVMERSGVSPWSNRSPWRRHMGKELFANCGEWVELVGLSDVRLWLAPRQAGGTTRRPLPIHLAVGSVPIR